MKFITLNKLYIELNSILNILHLILIFGILSTHFVFAHDVGTPPYMKINSEYVISNQMQALGIVISNFILPKDIAPRKYAVGESLIFQIDETIFRTGYARGSNAEISYVWDFGDGLKAEGTSNTHTYSKPGSYILVLTITVKSKDTPTPTQFIDSFLLHIMPDNKDTGLPEAVIIVNGKKVHTNPDTATLENVFDVNFDKPVIFDGSNSKSKSGQIVHYLWNFGDGETTDTQRIEHVYKKKDFETVVLRIIDEKGYIADTFVGLSHNPDAKDLLDSSLRKSNIILYTACGLVVATIGVVCFMKSKRSKNIAKITEK